MVKNSFQTTLYQKPNIMEPKTVNNPAGIYETDTLEDCFKRSDELSPPDGSSHSGMMCDRKDLRRIVLLTREVRRLQNEIKTEVIEKIPTVVIEFKGGIPDFVLEQKEYEKHEGLFIFCGLNSINPKDVKYVRHVLMRPQDYPQQPWEG